MRSLTNAMTTTLVLPQGIAQELTVAAQHPLETAGVLLVSVIRAKNGDIRLLGREMRWVDDSAYLRRERASLSIASEGYVHALAKAETLGAAGIWVHTHPGPDLVPLPSVHDRVVDREIADLFRLRSDNNCYGAAIFSPQGSGLSFTGHLDFGDGPANRIDRIWIVGDRLQLIRSFDSQIPGLSPIFDRNIRAFGSAVQRTLSDIRIGLVGCGGTVKPGTDHVFP